MNQITIEIQIVNGQGLVEDLETMRYLYVEKRIYSSGYSTLVSKPK